MHTLRYDELSHYDHLNIPQAENLGSNQKKALLRGRTVALNKENSTNMANPLPGKLGVVKKLPQLSENVQITNLSFKAGLLKSQST